MEIPSKIKVGPYEYVIKYPYEFGEWRDNRIGCVNHSTNELMLSSTDQGEPQCADRLWQTFLHEIVHIVSDIAQFDMNENEVDRVATLVLSVLKDNDWLTPEIKIAKEGQHENQ